MTLRKRPRDPGKPPPRVAAAALACAGALLGLCAAAAAPAVTGPAPPGEAVVGGEFPSILLSRQLAEAERLAVGDVVTLSPDPRGPSARRFRVAGIYEPLPDPTRLTARRLEARLHLPDLLAMTADPKDPQSLESAQAIQVALRDPVRAGAFASAVPARIPGLIAVPARPEGGPFSVLERFHQAIAAVTVLGSTAFLLALMIMRAEERRETVGILRLIGVRRSRILLEILLEGLLVSLAGSIFGVAFAAATQGAVNSFFQARYDTALVFVRITPGIALTSVALAVPLGALAGLAASWSVLRRGIVELIRR